MACVYCQQENGSISTSQPIGVYLQTFFVVTCLLNNILQIIKFGNVIKMFKKLMKYICLKETTTLTIFVGLVVT